MIDGYRFLDKNKLTEHAQTLEPPREVEQNNNGFIPSVLSCEGVCLIFE